MDTLNTNGVLGTVPTTFTVKIDISTQAMLFLGAVLVFWVFTRKKG